MRALAAQFEGLLFADVLRPLSASLGPLGEVTAEGFGAAIARGEHGGLTDAIVEALMREGALS